MGNASVGDQNVQTLIMGHDGFYRSIRGGTVGYVKGRRFSLEATITHSAGGDLECICVSAIEYDGSANLGQSLGHSETEAARCTGDERYSIIEIKMARHVALIEFLLPDHRLRPVSLLPERAGQRIGGQVVLTPRSGA
jgi:hypothetical protein